MRLLHKQITFLPFFLLLFLPVNITYGQTFSDRTGLVYNLDVEADGLTYTVQIVSNFDILDHSFDVDQKSLTLHIFSSLENNLGEVIIPLDLLEGDLVVTLDDMILPIDLRSNDRISFLTLNFTGSGTHQIDISDDDNLDFTQNYDIPFMEPQNGGGCLIATSAYGSELALQVQMLREIRDNQIINTEIGAAFMDVFGHIYYSFSPHMADYQRENFLFNEAVRLIITPLVTSLGIMSLADSEYKVLIYGILVMLLNAGIYIAAPLSAFVYVRRLATHLQAL